MSATTNTTPPTEGFATRAAPRHYPIPVCILARLAVTTAWQRQGVGSDLLRDALRRILAAAEEIGIRAVLVHAIDHDAAAFYKQCGFEPATADGLTLTVPLSAVRRQLPCH